MACVLLLTCLVLLNPQPTPRTLSGIEHDTCSETDNFKLLLTLFSNPPLTLGAYYLDPLFRRIQSNTN